MEGIRTYIEGGGATADGKTRLREGFTAFLKELVGRCQSRRMHWNLIACGPRESTYDKFRHALTAHPKSFSVLLVDAEDQVSASAWEHLRKQDRWDSLGASDDQCHLMVVMMESWFIADPDALERYYGHSFRRGALPAAQNVEKVPKHSIEEALKRATEPTKKGRYDKVRHGLELLRYVDPARVRSRAPHCDRLFQTLPRVISGG